MKITNAYNLLFRSSGVGNIMPAESKPFNSELTDTQLDKLVELFNEQVYFRRDEITSKYFEKGNARENDAITIVSRVLKKNFKKNTERRNNEFITGEWDLHEDIDGNIVYTLDTKCSWSKNTFDKAKLKKLNIVYWYQGHCYMWLTGALKHSVCYCLVNGTYQQLIDDIRKLQWKMGVLDGSVEENPKYIKAVMQLERNCIFDLNAFMKENPGYDLKSEYEVNELGIYLWEHDIPYQERIHVITFDRDLSVIEKIKNRIIFCRQYINKNLFKTT